MAPLKNLQLKGFQRVVVNSATVTVKV